VIQLNLPNIITIALAGMFGYGLLVAFTKVSSMVKGGG